MSRPYHRHAYPQLTACIDCWQWIVGGSGTKRCPECIVRSQKRMAREQQRRRRARQTPEQKARIAARKRGAAVRRQSSPSYRAKKKNYYQRFAKPRLALDPEKRRKYLREWRAKRRKQKFILEIQKLCKTK